MVVHQLFEILLRRVDVAEDLAAQTAFVVRDDQVDQFGHLDVFRRFVVEEPFAAEVVGRIAEKSFQQLPCRRRNGVGALAFGTCVVVGDVQSVGEVEVHQDLVQIRRLVVEENLFEGIAFVGHLFGVVRADSEEEYVPFRDSLPFVSVINVLLSADDISDRITRQRVQLDSVVEMLDEFHDHR